MPNASVTYYSSSSVPQLKTSSKRYVSMLRRVIALVTSPLLCNVQSYPFSAFPFTSPRTKQSHALFTTKMDASPPEKGQVKSHCQSNTAQSTHLRWQANELGLEGKWQSVHKSYAEGVSVQIGD